MSTYTQYTTTHLKIKYMFLNYYDKATAGFFFTVCKSHFTLFIFFSSMFLLLLVRYCLPWFHFTFLFLIYSIYESAREMILYTYLPSNDHNNLPHSGRPLSISTARPNTATSHTHWRSNQWRICIRVCCWFKTGAQIHPIPSHPILSHPILSYPILSHWTALCIQGIMDFEC